MQHQYKRLQCCLRLFLKQKHREMTCKPKKVKTADKRFTLIEVTPKPIFPTEVLISSSCSSNITFSSQHMKLQTIYRENRLGQLPI